MLLSQCFKPSERKLFIASIGFAILSLLIILFHPMIYLEVIISNIAIVCLLSILIRKFIFYSIMWIVILLLLLYRWETIDIELNKFKYYHSFEPLTKYQCLAAFRVDIKEISQNVHCQYGLSVRDKKEVNTYLKENNELVEHLRKLGCYRIDFSKNFVQLWYDDVVIDVKKLDNNFIVYEISDLK